MLLGDFRLMASRDMAWKKDMELVWVGLLWFSKSYLDGVRVDWTSEVWKLQF